METVDETTSNKIKVGIPRALHYFKYFPFWKKILEELDVEIILSTPTNKKLVEEGVTHGFGELCLPVKVYYGHALQLIREYPDLDYLFVPRYVSELKESFFCPKWLSLPDVIKILPDVPKLLNFEVNIKEFPLSVSVIDLAKQIGKSRSKALDAYKKAQDYYDEFLEFLRQGAPVNHALRLVLRDLPFKMPKKKQTEELKFLLLGHAYNLFDGFVNLDFIKKLNDQGVKVITIENMPESVFKQPVIVNQKLRNYWRHEEEIMQAIRYFLTKGRDEIDGVIFLISFACGPDSLISELIMHDMKSVGLPYIAIIIDEHSGDAGLLTRIQSFTDMIKRKKERMKELKDQGSNIEKKVNISIF
ncbi:MAG: acyl-CoA dehydratase activase-related protein [Candidatus Hermodarchaeota archaeon]